ncbi:MAG TPA: glycosyltransferase family 2 protein [Stellaceae bacterium]|nr:glycosyltransferase family 2 protein [Stellaceae bacterium]
MSPRVKSALQRGLALLPGPMQRLAIGFYRGHFVYFYDRMRRIGRPDAYRRWVRLYDTISAADRDAILAEIASFADRPLISVVMPVFNPPEPFLRAALASVRDQLYPNWELCIADDASTLPHVARVLTEYEAADPRIRVVRRPENGGISAASNSALTLAAGAFVALLDHDDVLPVHALYLVAREILRHPAADLIYSDEDKIDRRGRRFDPHFKSDWNPDLFLAQNMISHLGVYRTALIREVGGFRRQFDGSQDYDLALRVVARTEAGRIRHIPHILYHWRAIAGSAARSPTAKPHARTAARNAVADHLERRGLCARVDFAPGLSFQEIHYPLAAEPRVAIIIPSRDRSDLLARCLDGILGATDYRNFEVLIVDNQSRETATEALYRRIGADRRVRVLRYAQPFNFSSINNWAADHADGEILLFLNNDTEIIDKDWLRHLAANAARPEIGAVGAKLLYPDGRVQHGGVILGMGGVAAHFHLRRHARDPGYFGRARLQQNLSAVTAACLAMRRRVFTEIGGFDGVNLPVAFNDVDLCLRLRERGYLIAWTPQALLYHHESASRPSDLLPNQQHRFRREARYMRARWGAVLDRDPYFSPNLSLWDPTIALAFPPRVSYPWRTPCARFSDAREERAVPPLPVRSVAFKVDPPP